MIQFEMFQTTVIKRRRAPVFTAATMPRRVAYQLGCPLMLL